MFRRWAVSAAAGVVVSAAAAARQEAPPLQTLLVVDRAAMCDFLVSEKDRALNEALGMLLPRLRELRDEAPGMERVPAEVLGMVGLLSSRPVRLAITNKGFDEQTGAPGFGVVASCLTTSEEEARALHEQVEAMRGLGDMPFRPGPSRRFEGMMDLPLPVGVLSYGPRRSADGWRYELILGSVDDPDASFAGLPAAGEGVKPVFRATLDLAACSPLLQFVVGFAAMVSPEGAKVIDQFRSMGLLGPEAMKIDCVAGYAADSFRETWRVRGAGRFAEALGLSREQLTKEDLLPIPPDASFAGVNKVDFKGQWSRMKEQLESAGGDEFRERLARVREMLGFDAEREVVEALGTTAACYIADSTGGGSMLSAVVLVSASNPGRIASALETLAARANDLLKEVVPPPAAVEAAWFAREGAEWLQLRFPGLPVPIEPTVAVVGKWLVIGATPQAATAAARQITSGNGGLEASKAFAAGRWSLPGGVMPSSVMLVDSGRTIRDGYATVSLLSSALANVVRTRSDAEARREPGMVMPAYADLLDGARPMAAMTWWSGDDLEIEWRCDRSMLVNAAALLGVGDMMPFIAGLVSGGAIGTKAADVQGAGRRIERHGERHAEGFEDESDHEERPEREKAPY